MFSCCADTQTTTDEVVQSPQSVPSVDEAQASTPAEPIKEETPAAEPPAEPKDTSFKVTVTAPLGLALNIIKDGPLEIKAVNEGGNADKYNKDNGGILKAGLTILEVNGQTGTSSALVDEIKKGGSVELKLMAKEP
eukprot:CAMPEP_0197630324 /NCGR_PEP_ID=MMETSP1338-20131121/7852_1 /TAXON_ID=43686 ORGANISM="Pelagodinium beii, Strain RCC1491" /NCGR_SAMPLE_ID=MMETSP1338 /ASSEMBLY_ACC=CAM_ASM_000754 /LENGTH=135 /DNA_ID=CAMNT_0043201525 /DNA_START=108 /DNA_END=515 /DNA_ORIENTATION=+